MRCLRSFMDLSARFGLAAGGPAAAAASLAWKGAGWLLALAKQSLACQQALPVCAGHFMEGVPRLQVSAAAAHLGPATRALPCNLLVEHLNLQGWGHAQLLSACLQGVGKQRRPCNAPVATSVAEEGAVGVCLGSRRSLMRFLCRNAIMGAKFAFATKR